MGSVEASQAITISLRDFVRFAYAMRCSAGGEIFAGYAEDQMQVILQLIDDVSCS